MVLRPRPLTQPLVPAGRAPPRERHPLTPIHAGEWPMSSPASLCDIQDRAGRRRSPASQLSLATRRAVTFRPSPTPMSEGSDVTLASTTAPPGATATDDTLIDRVLAGDTAAFEPLMRR